MHYAHQKNNKNVPPSLPLVFSYSEMVEFRHNISIGLILLYIPHALIFTWSHALYHTHAPHTCYHPTHSLFTPKK